MPISSSIFLIFSSRSVRILDVKLRSLIHLDFCEDERHESNFIHLQVYPVLTAPLGFFSYFIFLSLCQKLIGRSYMGFFLGPICLIALQGLCLSQYHAAAVTILQFEERYVRNLRQCLSA